MDNINKTGKLIGKMKPLNAMIFVLLIFTVLDTGMDQWNSIFDRKDRQALLEQIVILNKQNGELILDQIQSKMIKKCVKDAQDEQMDEFNNILIPQLGKTLQENNIVFPQELNQALSRYRQKMNNINTCLIFPE